MLDDWHLRTIHKLTKDDGAIGDPFDQFMYIYSQLKDEAVNMVSTTTRDLSETRTGHEELLDYLNAVFGEPSKKSRAHQQL